MPKLETFAFRLNNPQQVYLPGDTLDGSVIVVLREAMKMRGLRVTFIGKGYVHWTEQHSSGSGDHRRTKTVHYSAEEYYFNQRVVLWGKDSSCSYSEYMPPGRQEFHFSFRLPGGIPSSFEGEWGYVRYMIKGTVDKPWKFDHHTKTAFTVISQYDLNMDPSAKEVVMHQGEVDVCCCCCAQGTCNVVFRLDCRGYVPGEIVTVIAEVGNHSSNNWSLEFKLKMVISFHSTSKTRHSETELARMAHPCISANTSDVWQEDLRLPPLPPSHLRGCSIIDIDYIVRFKAVPDGCNCDSLEYHDEILIGTIPLRRPVAPMYLPQPSPDPSLNMSLLSPSAPPGMPDAIPMGAMAAPGPSAPPPSYKDLPPPSYEECMFGKVDIRDDDDNEYTGGEMRFAPIYPYYNFNQHPGPGPSGQNLPPSSQNINRI